jgi:redox-regulated HSP33 family molecular chaperone
MLNIKSLQILLRITSRLDLTPVIDTLKDADIFTDAKSKEDALAQLTTEKAGELAVTAISALLPQLDTVADFLPELAAAYKGVTVEEANDLDTFAVLDEIIHDEGMTVFFKRALHDKVKPKRAD